MITEFSETQFSFGITRELEDDIVWRSLGYAKFPTLREEAELGYDVSFDHGIHAIFLQYKVPKYLKRSNAKQWEVFQKPYYRFHIYKRSISNQHQKLYELSLRHPKTYYCSPGFHSFDDYYKYRSSSSISQHSIFIPVRGLGAIRDNERHFIAYNINPNVFYMFSEPKEVKGIRGYKELLYSDQRYDSLKALTNFIYKSFSEEKKFNDFESKKLVKSNNNNNRLYIPKDLELIGEYLMTEYNVELLVVKSRA